MATRLSFLLFLCTNAISFNNDPPEVRFLAFAPSKSNPPNARRFDTVRAGLGISLHLHMASIAFNLPTKITFFNGTSRLHALGGSDLNQLFKDADIIMIGSETWDVGSTQYLRTAFAELDVGSSLIGGTCAAWACSGGSYSGGEMVIMDTLRSLMAYGCEIFQPLTQRHAVWTTDERVGDGLPGEFTLLDSWLMRLAAYRVLIKAHSRGDPKRAQELANKIGWTPYYYRNFPTLSDLQKMHDVMTVQNDINNATSLTNMEVINKIATFLNISVKEITP